jgi:hypothetical protein
MVLTSSVLHIVTGPCRRLSCLVLGAQSLGPVDICLLAALGPAAKQHNQRFAVFRQIDPITRTPIDDVFADARKPLHVRPIAEFHAQLRGRHFRRRLRVEAVEPVSVGTRSIRANVFFHPDFQWRMVTFALPYCKSPVLPLVSPGE